MTFPWLEDSARILGAATPDALWRHLCENVHLRAMPNTFEAVCAFQCAARSKADTDSGAIRTPVPDESGHSFRLIPDT
jgi:hypothetical protein